MLCRIKIGIKSTLNQKAHALEKCRQSWRFAGQIYKLPGSCFNSKNEQITSLALKMERKNINRCLGGLRMEDQGERSLQNFLQPRRKQGDRFSFKRVLNTDSGFKAAAWT